MDDGAAITERRDENFNEEFIGGLDATVLSVRRWASPVAEFPSACPFVRSFQRLLSF